MTQSAKRRSDRTRGIILCFGTIGAILAAQAALLFGGAGALQWPWAWIYFAISLATVLIGRRGEHAQDQA